MDDQNIIFVRTKEDVMECARMKGIPDEAITDDVLRQVRKMVDSGLECWSEVVSQNLQAVPQPRREASFFYLPTDSGR